MGKLLFTVTPGQCRLDLHRKSEPRDPGPPLQTLHSGHADLSTLEIGPEHQGVLVHPASSRLPTIQNLPGQGPQSQLP